MTTVDLSPVLDPLIQVGGLILTGLASWAFVAAARFLHISAQSKLMQNLLGAVDRGISYGTQTATTFANANSKLSVQSATQAAAENYVLQKMPGTLKALGVTPDHLADLVLAQLPKANTSPVTVSIGPSGNLTS